MTREVQAIDKPKYGSWTDIYNLSQGPDHLICLPLSMSIYIRLVV